MCLLEGPDGMRAGSGGKQRETEGWRKLVMKIKEESGSTEGPWQHSAAPMHAFMERAHILTHPTTEDSAA